MVYSTRLFISLGVLAVFVLMFCGCETTTEEQEQEQEQISIQVFAEHGAWTWFNDERALFTDSHLFVGYVDTAGYSSVSIHFLEEDEESRTFRLGSFQEKDDHNNPALVELEDGTVLATYAAHHTEPFWYHRFADVTESGSVNWTEEKSTKQLEANTTYSNLFQLSEENGRIYNFYRGINFDPTFMTSNDEGQTWSAEHHFISSGDRWTRPYVKYASNGVDRIDMLFTQAHPRDAETNIYHAYYHDRNLYQSDGTRIQSIPGNETSPMTVDSGTLIYDAEESGRAWVWDLEYGMDGNPVAVFVSAKDSTVGNDLRYHYATWNDHNQRWNEVEAAYAGTHLYDGENHYAGGITIDPTDPNTIYISSDVHPETADSTHHYQIYRGITSDNGNSWTWTTITPVAEEDNIRPFVPRGGHDHHAVLWLRGRYTTYMDYETDIVGLLK